MDIGPEKSEICPDLSFSSPPRCPNFDLKIYRQCISMSSYLLVTFKDHIIYISKVIEAALLYSFKKIDCYLTI